MFKLFSFLKPARKSETKTVTIHVTAEDLDNKFMFLPGYCAGFKAVKRIIPSLNGWAWSEGDTTDAKVHWVKAPDWVGDKLRNHAFFMANSCGLKTEPFSFEMEVPVSLPTVALQPGDNL